jgi:hypothetical protein
MAPAPETCQASTRPTRQFARPPRAVRGRFADRPGISSRTSETRRVQRRNATRQSGLAGNGDALSFAEALLDHIYVLRKRFDEFKARRAAKP